MVILSWILYGFIIDAEAAVNYATVKTVVNSTVLLPCYVHDLGVQIRVMWWGKGVLLANSDDPRLVPPQRIKLWPNKTLEVFNVQPEDSGEYVCQTSSPTPWGYAARAHKIEVLYPPSLQTIPESGELEVNMKEEVDMTCKAKGVPVPIVTWWSKGEQIHLSDNYRLTFHADNRDLAGRYTCIANNGIGEPVSATIDLRIRYTSNLSDLDVTVDKPEIIVQKSWVHASPGIRAHLHCRVTAWPEAEVEWCFQNKTIQYSSRLLKHSEGNNHSLIIRNVMIEDYGIYLCRASNSLGITEAIVELSGAANSAVFKEAQIISKTAYGFIWEIDCYSRIIEYQFSFRKYGKVRTGNNNSSLHKWHKLYIPSGSDAIGPVHARSFNLTGLVEGTHYEAFVLSRNRFGWSKPSKIIRFATEGAPPDVDEYYTTDVLLDEKTNPVVQLASISQHSPLDAQSSASFCKRNTFLTIVQTVLCISFMKVLQELITIL